MNHDESRVSYGAAEGGKGNIWMLVLWGRAETAIPEQILEQNEQMPVSSS